MKIEFVRFERACLTNQTLRDAGDQRGFIYDFAVIVDGEKRGTWKKSAFRRGYSLYDMDSVQVRAPWFDNNGRRRIEDKDYHWHDIEADTQADFEAVTIKEFDYIPTLAQIEQRRADEERKARRAAAESRELERIARIKETGPQLLVALETLLAEYEANMHGMAATAPRRAMWIAAREASNTARGV
jgi:hypothetical protein